MKLDFVNSSPLFQRRSDARMGVFHAARLSENIAPFREVHSTPPIFLNFGYELKQAAGNSA
jgi:hypothetical protein